MPKLSRVMEILQVDEQFKRDLHRLVAHKMNGMLSTDETGLIDTCLLSIEGATVDQEVVIHCLIPTLYLMRSLTCHQVTDGVLRENVLQGDYYSSLFYRYMVQHHSLRTLKRVLKVLQSTYLANVSNQQNRPAPLQYFHLLWQGDDTPEGHRSHHPVSLSDVKTLDTYKQQVKIEMVSLFTMFDSTHNDALSALMTSGGKQTRLTLFYHALTKDSSRQRDLLSIGIAIEGIHLASLIHDDIIDQADMRRHQQTLHEKFTPYTALHMGNAIFTQSLLALADIEDREVHRVFSRLFYQMVHGEIQQQSNRYNCHVSTYRYLKVIRDKTALFVESILYLAGYLSGYTNDTLRHFRRSGYYIGMAYQLKDDIFDYTSTAATLGKPVASDQKNGYYTLASAVNGPRQTTQLAHRFIERALIELRQLPTDIDQRELIYYTTILYKRTR
ncbi:Geranylgeranyl pyrophosphate synthase [Halolactibacillus miurensis]|uniref:Geranylgeranyl pyrophosphate synthase n=2 Tax=Halolactibacillus miurensis TaxID=306541 RepID=A0A1I6SWN7_9BACI|nr:Geranylgeranyl pyrophosphate synthase [Halolactibacillus miurensis]